MELTCQRAKRAPGPVARRQRRVEPDHAAGLAQAPVQLVVLVAHQRLVEEPDRLDCITPEHPQVDGVNRTLVAPVVEAGIAGTEARRHPKAHRVFEPVGSLGPLHATHVHRPGSLQRRHRRSDVPGRQRGMPVDAHHHRSRRCPDGCIQSGRCDPGRVVDHLHPRVPGRQRRGHPGRVVTGRRHSKADLHVAAVLLTKHRSHRISQTRRLVAHRHDHSHARQARPGAARQVAHGSLRSITTTVAARIWRSRIGDQAIRYCRS